MDRGTPWLVGLVLLWALPACGSLAGRGGAPEWPFRLAVDLGATEFHGGDEVAIHEVRATERHLAPGVRIRVVGRWALHSRENAALLLWTTQTTSADGPSRSTRSSQQIVARGAGEFTLHHTIPGPGYPHLTFYDVDSGKPFGGVYFGTGEWLLEERTWPYDGP